MGSDIHYSHAHLSTRRRKPEAGFPKAITCYYDLEMWKNKVLALGNLAAGGQRLWSSMLGPRAQSTQPINTPPPFNVQSEQTEKL